MPVEIDNIKSGGHNFMRKGDMKGASANEGEQSNSKTLDNKCNSLQNVQKAAEGAESSESDSLCRNKESDLQNNKVVKSRQTIENCMQKKSLILCLNNMKREIFSMLYKKKDESTLTFPKKVSSAEMEKNNKEKENQQMIITQLQKELVGIQTNISEISDLVSDLKLVIDNQMNRLRENPVKNHHNIYHYKKTLDKRFQTIQQKLQCMGKPENNYSGKKYNLKGKISRDNIKESPSFSMVDGGSSKAPTPVKQEKHASPSLTWNINDLTQKRKTHVEMWSNYFYSVDKRFTMRLWLHLNEILVSSLFSIELLIWDNCETTDSELFFKGHIKICVKNYTKPQFIETISRLCEIEKPKFSDVFNFNYSDLKKAGILTSDSITIECTVSNVI